MSSYIDPSFRIDIYLDTNILVDYIEGNYPALTYSLNYLAQSGYVTFRSSQYVLYEFAEVRKFNIYLSKLNLKPEPQGEDKKKLKAQIKSNNWKYKNVAYIDSLQTDIETQVIDELSSLDAKLGLETNLHFLHKELYLPSLLCVLKTPISKEDSLVLASSVLPKEDVRLGYSVILSGDKAYGTAFNNNAEVISNIDGFNNANINFIKITNLSDPITGREINLRNNQLTDSVVENTWNHIVLAQLCKKNESRFVGTTYKWGSSRKCVFFQRENNSLPLESDGNFWVIPKDLSFAPMHSGDGLGIQYYGENISFPHRPDFTNARDTKYSFLAPESFKGKMDILSQDGNLIFYDTD